MRFWRGFAHRVRQRYSAPFSSLLGPLAHVLGAFFFGRFAIDCNQPGEAGKAEKFFRFFVKKY